MRADRLLSMLMILQTRGRTTARKLAGELEVSERTVYRDVVALSAAGVPVYTEGGPGGGISLLESYRTDLTGMSHEEVRALAMLNIPEPLVRLGVGQELKAALLKLSAAILPTGREQQARAQQRIHLDATWWFQPEEPMPCLQTLQQAVWQDRILHITSRSNFGVTNMQEVAPYGLVAKASIWYLVYACGDSIRARRVAHILAAEMLEGTFERPADFDLAAFWKAWCEEFERDRPRYEVRARVLPSLAERLPQLLHAKQVDTLNTPPSAQQGEWCEMTLTFESLENARSRLLGFGGAIEVLEPVALRASLADYGEQIRARYAAT
jgi:predicted DNA-binding transcriptional regulator YafY